MKKTEIRVKINSIEDQKILINMLYKYNQKILEFSDILEPGFIGIIGFSDYTNVWCEYYTMEGGKKITLNKLETILKNEVK